MAMDVIGCMVFTPWCLIVFLTRWILYSIRFEYALASSTLSISGSLSMDRCIRLRRGPRVFLPGLQKVGEYFVWMCSLYLILSLPFWSCRRSLHFKNYFPFYIDFYLFNIYRIRIRIEIGLFIESYCISDSWIQLKTSESNFIYLYDKCMLLHMGLAFQCNFISLNLIFCNSIFWTHSTKHTSED